MILTIAMQARPVIPAGGTVVPGAAVPRPQRRVLTVAMALAPVWSAPAAIVPAAPAVPAPATRVITLEMRVRAGK